MFLRRILVGVMSQYICEDLALEGRVVFIELLGDLVLVADALLLGFERQVGAYIGPCKAEIEQAEIVLIFFILLENLFGS